MTIVKSIVLNNDDKINETESKVDSKSGWLALTPEQKLKDIDTLYMAIKVPTATLGYQFFRVK